jgi:hypothetical protein
MSDRDVDAQFADIIAHWDDVAPVPDRSAGAASAAPAPSGPGVPDDLAEGTTEDLTDGTTEDLTDRTTGDVTDGTTGAAAAEPGPDLLPDRSDGPDPVNPSPLLGGIPVWRGATGPAAPHDESSPPPAQDVGEDDDQDDDEEHFEPGPTAPLPPQEDLHFWGIVVGLVTGPLLLLWLVIFRPNVSDWWVLAALGLTVGGFVLLVLRQPRTRDENDPDDGARV